MTKIFPFIKLTNFYDNGGILYLLSLEITGIRKDKDEGTWIFCGGTHYRVKETAEEVIAMVNLAYGDDDEDEKEPWE